MRAGAWASLWLLAACAPPPAGGTLRIGARTYAFTRASDTSSEITLSGDADPNISARVEYLGSGTGIYPHDATDPTCTPCTRLFELHRAGAVIATSRAAGREAELRAQLKVTQFDDVLAAELTGFLLVTDPGASDDGQVVALSGSLHARPAAER